jgi:glycosyltransferase involved in cell wall biosynthesis/GT2 family glycosyltransferase
MTSISIGIHVHAEPTRLRGTLESLERHTNPKSTILLFPDGPDRETELALGQLGQFPQYGTAQPLGAAACFNRLAAVSKEAQILVLLESGCIVGPGWLDHLLQALESNPSHGLVGPSTNRSWNEQGAFPRAGGSPAEVAQTAQEALSRFYPQARTLEPLYSLADFCYVVRREVVESVGAADEQYGLGPCWEMDYNIRAARAGFSGVWACYSYVYRAPFSARRRLEESRRFSASKQLYQDRFCGLRLRGNPAPYESHCRGDACEYFAPVQWIQIHRPLSEIQTVEPQPQIQAKAAQPAVLGEKTEPLVSCIMPTGNRPDFVLQSIRYLQRQDYSSWELVIIDDGREGLESRLPPDGRIRYEHIPPGLSIGLKRNRACELARGEIIAQWDDDDWYSAQRLSAQVAPLRCGAAEISGLTGTLFFELKDWRFWNCTRPLHRRLFVEDVHGGTLVYFRRVWENLSRYPDRSLAEDAVFLKQAMRRGARLQRLPNDDLYVYLRHQSNSWSFACGTYLDPAGWLRAEEPRWSPEDRAFYAALAPAPQAVTRASKPVLPMVSCIMPTADRRGFVPAAIRYFLRQDYPHKELVIVDDGRDSIADLVPEDPAIRYFRSTQKQSVGAKRNFACQQARGEIILHWDDDDWMAPWRLTCQVDQLLTSGADLCGLNKVYYLMPETGQAWQYVYPENGQAWVAGNTLCYRRSLWQKNPFQDINIGEDTRFVWGKFSKEISVLQDPSFIVALIHKNNVSPKRTSGNRWRPQPVEAIWKLLGEDVGQYRGMVSREETVDPQSLPSIDGLIPLK